MAARSYEDFLDALVEIIKNPDKPELKWGGYTISCEHAKEMAVHLSGDKPQALLERVRPREDRAITNYRLESYEPTTQSTAEKGVTLVNKMFNPKLFGIKPKEGQKGKQLYDYAMVEYPVFNSIIQYYSAYGMKKTLEDSNAYFVYEPFSIPTRYNEATETDEIDPTIQIKPVVNCYESERIYFEGLDYIVIYLDFKEVKDGGTTIKTWKYKYVDTQVITVFEIFTTNGQDYNQRVISVYNHYFGELPATKCGGTYHSKIKGLFVSFFFPAVPFWNKAINAASDLDGAFISHLHPQWWSVAEECQYVEYKNDVRYDCKNGTIWGESGSKMCPACSGTGRKAKGPYETLMVARDKLQDPSGNTLNQPPGGYIDVPTEATKMLVEREQMLLEKGLSALNMDIVNKIGNNQSGEAKAYDRTELFDFLGKIRDLFFDKHIVNTFYFFGKYMFFGIEKTDLKENVEPTVIKPHQFDIYTTDELVNQLKTTKEAGVNPAYLQGKSAEVINKEFQSHPEALQFMNLVNELDPLAEISRTDVSAMVLDKSVNQTTVILHDNIREFVRRALEEQPDFGKGTYSEKMELITGYAEERAGEIDEEAKVQLEAAQAAMIAPDGLDPNKADPTKDDAE